MSFSSIKIGSLSLKNNVFLAPMAGITDLSFRLLNREYGVGLAFTEMVSAVGLKRGTGKTHHYLDASPEDRPLGVQIFGADADVLAEAAKFITDRGFDILDINMGCPVKKVVKTGAGAALLRDTGKIDAILKSVRKATHLPLTVKIRSGWRQREINCLDVANIAEDCGADAVILHPRTADQGFSGVADWKLIGNVKKHVKIPVIGNGDIRTAADAMRMLVSTSCDGIMVGRGCLGNPWIFKDIISISRGCSDVSPPTPAEREKVIREHLAVVVGTMGESAGVRYFRKHLLWYTKGLRGGARFRQCASLAKDRAEVFDALHDFLHSAGLETPAS